MSSSGHGSDDSVRGLISQARQGEPHALGRLLEGHRDFLRRLARKMIGPQLQTRIDDSDVVQLTLASAVRKFGDFEGQEPAEFAAWLKSIHECNIRDVFREHLAAGKRALTNEERLGNRQPTCNGLDAANQSTPSRRAIRNEELALLRTLIDRLPPDQRRAVRMKCIENRPLSQVAMQLERSEAAVAGLVKRGLDKLRKMCEHEEESDGS